MPGARGVELVAKKYGFKQKNPKAVDDLLKRYKDSSKLKLAVGWPKATEAAGLRYPDGTSVLMVAAANNFGAAIDHPGGTKYTIGPDGKARFVPNEFAGAVAGTTKPHRINIPARPFMRHAVGPAVAATTPVKLAMVPAFNAGEATAGDVLNAMGPFAEAAFKQAITDLRDPPNAASTVRAKKSDNPLIDTGLMRGSLTHQVRAGEQ